MTGPDPIDLFAADRIELRPSNPAEPGITRRRRGRHFSYHDARGRRIRDRETLRRVKALAIPPAWTDVWICADPAGHIQAVGTDAAGRRQYRYHDAWRRQQDEAKFDRVLDLAEHSTRSASGSRAHLAGRAASPGCACSPPPPACSTSASSGSAARSTPTRYGLATLRVEHITCHDGIGRLRATRPRAASGASRSSPTRRCARWCARCAPGARASCSRYREDGAWRDVQQRRHQRLPEGGVRRGGERQGLPHLACDRARRGRARRLRGRARRPRPEARRGPGDEGGGRVPGQHPGRGPRLLRRSRG